METKLLDFVELKGETGEEIAAEVLVVIQQFNKQLDLFVPVCLTVVSLCSLTMVLKSDFLKGLINELVTIYSN